MNEFKYKMENFQKVKDKENNFKLFIKKKKKKKIGVGIRFVLDLIIRESGVKF